MVHTKFILNLPVLHNFNNKSTHLCKNTKTNTSYYMAGTSNVIVKKFIFEK